MIMGGRPDQDLGGDSPVDVAGELRALGLGPAGTLEQACRLLGERGPRSSGREFT